MRRLLQFLAVVPFIAPVAAATVQQGGRTLTIDESGSERAITAIESTRYAVRLSAPELLAEARSCVDAAEGASLLPAAGEAQDRTIRARLRGSYRAGMSMRVATSMLTLSAEDGGFRLRQTDVASAPQSDPSSSEPLGQKSSGWEKAVDAVLKVENRVVDCLYR